MTEQGHVLAVTQERFGDDLAAAASAGATNLTVGDIADFDELGGTLWINGQIIAYISTDDETGVIELAGTLAAAAVAGDKVFEWDPTRQVIVTDLVAQVMVDGDTDGDPHECSVDYKLVQDLPGGIRGLVGESVRIEEEDDDWRVVDILGLGSPDASGTLFKRDVMTVSATGDQTMTLTYEPLQDSLHLRWEPINMDDTEWTRDGRVVTIPDALNPFEVGDVITAKYAYRRGRAIVDLPEFSADGWKVLSVSEADSTDRSGRGYDDSGFTDLEFPTSNSLTAHPEPTWPTPATAAWPVHTILWVRRLIATDAGADHVVRIRVDDYLGGVWWNGTLIHAAEASSTPYGERTVDVDRSLVTGSDILAIKGRDSAAGARTYMDVQVEIA